MKKLSVFCMFALVFALMAGSAFAIGYGTDFLEPGNPGGWGGSSLKTFDTTWTMNTGDTVDVDIWINDIPEAQLLTAGFWIVFNPAQVSIPAVKVYDGDLTGTQGNPTPCCPGLAGPWDPTATTQVPDAGGPGTYFVALANFGCVTRDAGNGIILGNVTFQCVAVGDAAISVQPIPDFDTIVGCGGTNYDLQITPLAITIQQTQTCTVDPDNCSDGVFCNGLETCVGGTCQPGTNPCTLPQLCNEETDACVDCIVNGDCADSSFCNGTETCVGGTCQPGTNPCLPESECNNCQEAGGGAGTCFDPFRTPCTGDGLYCNGPDICNNGNCVNDLPPCASNEICIEDTDECVVSTCSIAIDGAPSRVVVPSGTIQFGATVDGTCADPCFTWEISLQGCTADSGSTIDNTGLYTACPGTGTDRVSVTDGCNLDITATAEVIVRSQTTTTTTTGGGGVTTTTVPPPTSTTVPPPIYKTCVKDEDCNDGVFCNGAEDCQFTWSGSFQEGTDTTGTTANNRIGICQTGKAPCPDDGKFCTGQESCNEANDTCKSSGNPCTSQDLLCDENKNICVETIPCVDNADCDDGLFCNGAETCVNGDCTTGVTPCLPNQECDEQNDTCLSKQLSFTLVPNSAFRSNLTPLPLFMFIRSEDDATKFDSTTAVSFSGDDVSTPPFKLVLSEDLIFTFSVIKAAGLTGAEDSTDIEVQVVTSAGEGKAILTLRTLPFPLNEGKGKLKEDAF